MDVIQHSNAYTSNLRVRDFLRRNEALHHRMLSSCYSLLQKPERFEAETALITLESDAALVGVGMLLPGRALSMTSLTSLEGVTRLAEYLNQRYGSLSRLNAPTEVAEHFVQVWQSLSGQSAYLGMTVCAYQLETIRPFIWAQGHLEPATEKDLALVSQWFTAFGLEALGDSATDSDAWAKGQIERGNAFLWHDGQPVAMGCRIGQTEHGFRLSIIYTPPEHRQRGYGKTCTAALTQRLLEDGQPRCCLYADKANGVTNRMYEGIGYTLSGESKTYHFEPLTAN
ncbi:GNAT family N-acetyltransferase [Nodosilinea sp. AN01ver1]|uniref:GNAT family N-acetyltransferase n=1 Tax=Nodosilinea sp. AN01ver1 TaxID=3423362 RepID=UPI003D315CEE